MLQKTFRRVGYTFLQNPLSFDGFNILEENCGADIKNETFKCRSETKSFKLTRVVLGGDQKRPFLRIILQLCSAHLMRILINETHHIFGVAELFHSSDSGFDHFL